MSKILFDTYKESITFISDSSAKVDFTTSTLSMLPGKDFKMPFRMVYGMDFLVGLSAKMLAKEGKPDKQISIAYLHAARQTFVEWWFNQKRNKDYPNPLIDFHKELKENNHMEAYNYWLLRMGDEKEFKAWYEANTEKFLAFAEWFKKRGDIVSKEKFFIRPED